MLDERLGVLAGVRLTLVVIDQRFAGSGCADERDDGGVVQRQWQTQAAFMESHYGIISDERISAPDQRQVVTQVRGGFGQVHRCQLGTRGMGP